MVWQWAKTATGHGAKTGKWPRRREAADPAKPPGSDQDQAIRAKGAKAPGLFKS